MFRRTGQHDRHLPLVRRPLGEELAEELRRLDADQVYAEALGATPGTGWTRPAAAGCTSGRTRRRPSGRGRGHRTRGTSALTRRCDRVGRADARPSARVASGTREAVGRRRPHE